MESMVRLMSRRFVRAAVFTGGLGLAMVLAGLGDPEEARAQTETGRAKNVIFMMGDGMGAAQRESIQLGTVGPYDKLAMDSLPYEGMVGTDPVDPKTFVTDSAASGTAMATGVKTVNGAVGVGPDGKSFASVLEQAKAAGKSVGLVTTSQVTDASPASFAAHIEDRDKQSEIARQYIQESQPDVILGGGEDYWYPKGNAGAFPDNPGKEEKSQSDKGNLVEQAKRAGYQYVTNSKDLKAAGGAKILGLFANEEMFKAEPEGKGDQYNPAVSLPTMTSKAIDVLSRNPNGFFLFVEEEGTDEMGHANNSKLTIKSGQALDKSVGIAKDYAGRSGDTLLITTADHETGGLTVEETNNPEYPDESGGHEGDKNANLSTEDGPFPVANSDYKFVMDWTTTGHTGVDVPLTATGPGAELLTGNYENTHIHDVMAQSLSVAGLKPVAAGEVTMPDTGGFHLGWSGLLAGGVLSGVGCLLFLGLRLRRS